MFRQFSSETSCGNNLYHWTNLRITTFYSFFWYLLIYRAKKNQPHCLLFLIILMFVFWIEIKRPGWCHQSILFVFCNMKLLQNSVKVYVSLFFFLWQCFASMFPASRKWGPRTGKMTNHFPAFCFETRPVPHCPFTFFSPIYVWEVS